MNLYQLHDMMKQAEDALNDGHSPDDVAATIEALDIDFKQKCVQVAYFMRNLESDIKAIKAEEDRLSSRRNITQKHYDRLKEYLADAMVSAGENKASDGVIGVTIGKPKPILVINDDSSIPDSYRKIKVSTSVDKTALLNALKDGADVDGAEIGEGKHSVSIK